MEIYNIAQDCLFQSIGSFGLDASSLSISLYNISVENIDLAHLHKINPIRISSVGVEPWIAPSILPNRSYKVLGLSKELPTRYENEAVDLIWAILANLGLEIQTSLHKYATGVSLVPIPPPSKFPIRGIHKRRDHQYRLVGVYSTAQLKYNQICACFGLKHSSSVVHLAEGAAGVSRSSHFLLGATKIIYNTLLEVPSALSHRTYRHRPAELQDLQNVDVIGPEYCYTTGGDITNEGTISLYKEAVKKHREEINLITCDAEFPFECTKKQVLDLLLSFLRVIKYAENGTLLIFKTFCRIPEYLMLQSAIWVQAVQDPQLIVPKFSSHESSEIFLVGKLKSGFSITDCNVVTMPLSLMVQIENICRKRGTTQAFLHEAEPILLKDLFTAYDSIGIHFNLIVAIKIFLHYTGTIEVDLDDLPLLCAKSIDHATYHMNARIRIMASFISGKRVKDRHRELVRETGRDSTELTANMETIVNANILRSLLLKREVPAELMLKRWKQELDFGIEYTYQVNLEDWSNKYGRSFHKIVGFCKTIASWEVIIPEFL